MNQYKNKDLKTFISNLDPDDLEEKNIQQFEENKRIHEDFISNLEIGKCFLCGEGMDSFDESKECFHWFTYPIGIRKKHFEAYLRKPVGFYKLDSYFRWLANSEVFLTNINDLKGETSKTSFLESTFRYKNIEWAFSIGNSDLEGHKNAKIGVDPHYHIQMLVDGRVFLKFNDFHIPFSDEDLFVIELQKQMGDQVIVNQCSQNAGIGIIENKDIFEEVEKLIIKSEDINTAPFRRQTMIVAPEGQTLSEEVIQRAVEENSRTKEPISKIMQRLVEGADVISYIIPGHGVPDMTKRSGKK